MLSDISIERILTSALEHNGDFAEVFCDNNKTTSISINASVVENGVVGRDFGVGIRILSGLQNIYTYSNDVREENLIKMAKEASKILKKSKNTTEIRPLGKLEPHITENVKIFPEDISYGKKIDMLNTIVNAGNSYDSRIKKVSVNYYDGVQDVKIANTEGLNVSDSRVKTRIRIGALAVSGENMYMGYIGPAAMTGFEFYENIDLEWHAKEASRIAIDMLFAKNAPVGKMSVVVDNGFGGLLFHEACGHSLESSSVAKNTSEFSGKLGQNVASPILTLIDDGSIPGKWGSLNIDDEGYKTRKNILIENGVLKGYMIDRLGARRMNTEPTGSSRRQSYRFAPASRMTNTYIAAGESKREDIIANTERGIFVKYINAGSVSPLTGEFNFSTSESYMIENGKLTYPVKGATLIGTGREILNQVDMIGDNLKMGDGFCFSQSGSLFVCAGQPTVRVKTMTVGGAE